MGEPVVLDRVYCGLGGIAEAINDIKCPRGGDKYNVLITPRDTVDQSTAVLLRVPARSAEFPTPIQEGVRRRKIVIRTDSATPPVALVYIGAIVDDIDAAVIVHDTVHDVHDEKSETLARTWIVPEDRCVPEMGVETEARERFVEEQQKRLREEAMYAQEAYVPPTDVDGFEPDDATPRYNGPKGFYRMTAGRHPALPLLFGGTATLIWHTQGGGRGAIGKLPGMDDFAQLCSSYTLPVDDGERRPAHVTAAIADEILTEITTTYGRPAHYTVAAPNVSMTFVIKPTSRDQTNAAVLVVPDNFRDVNIIPVSRAIRRAGFAALVIISLVSRHPSSAPEPVVFARIDCRPVPPRPEPSMRPRVPMPARLSLNPRPLEPDRPEDFRL